MRTRSLLPSRWPAWVWLLGLGVVLLLRFPANFLLHPPWLMDFEVYRTVACRIVDGGASRLYEPATSELGLFKYAPCWAMIWLPLAWLPDHAGGVLWSVLTVAWFLLACRGSAALCESAGLRPPPWSSAAAALLLNRALLEEFLNGQVNALWALLIILFLRASSIRPVRAAVCLALAISLKLPALLFVPYLALRGRWRLVLHTLAAALALNTLASLLLDPAHPLRLLGQWVGVLASSGPARAFEIGNQSLLALLGRFLSADAYGLNVARVPLAAVPLVAAAAGIGLFLLVIADARPGNRHSTSVVFDGALLSTLMVLLSPTTWVATYSACVLPMIAAVACCAQAPRTRGSLAASALGAASTIVLSVMTLGGFWKAVGLRRFRGESYVYLVFMIFPWLGLALFGYLWWQRRIRCRPSAPAPA